MKREDFSCILAVLALVIAAICGGVWLCGASNPHTPAGYVGYVTARFGVWQNHLSRHPAWPHVLWAGLAGGLRKREYHAVHL